MVLAVNWDQESEAIHFLQDRRFRPIDHIIRCSKGCIDFAMRDKYYDSKEKNYIRTSTCILSCLFEVVVNAWSLLSLHRSIIWTRYGIWRRRHNTAQFIKCKISLIFPSLQAGVAHAALDCLIHNIWTKRMHSIENVLTAAKLIANCNGLLLICHLPSNCEKVLGIHAPIPGCEIFETTFSAWIWQKPFITVMEWEREDSARKLEAGILGSHFDAASGIAREEKATKW
jgi:hypothetical protein